MIKLILVRHTETKWNEERRYIGRTDLGLSRLGKKNAHLMADYFKDETLTAIYSSAMRRAKQTAMSIAAYHNLPVKETRSLNEFDFGDWEGLTHEEISDSYSQLINSWIQDPLAAEVPGGERWRSFETRVHKGVSEIINNEREGLVVVVSHGGPIKVIIGSILKIPASSYWQVHQDKGAINAISYDNGRNQLLLLNDTCYRRLKNGQLKNR